MTTIIEVLDSLGIFLVGLLARLGLAVLFAALFIVPILLSIEAWRGAGWLRRRLLGLTEVGGFPWMSGLYYAPGHTWLRKGWARGLRVGIDGLAQRLIPDVRGVVLPKPGTRVEPGTALADVSAGGRRLGVVSPVAGTVVRVNERLREEPTRLTREPYRGGWLVEVSPDGEEYARLPRGRSAREWFRGEGQRFVRFLERDLGLAAADGGEPILPAPALLADEKWKALTASFLGSAPEKPAAKEDHASRS